MGLRRLVSGIAPGEKRFRLSLVLVQRLISRLGPCVSSDILRPGSLSSVGSHSGYTLSRELDSGQFLQHILRPPLVGHQSPELTRSLSKVAARIVGLGVLGEGQGRLHHPNLLVGNLTPDLRERSTKLALMLTVEGVDPLLRI
jgi:hypothetical protein